jgi:hypothetical protein
MSIIREIGKVSQLLATAHPSPKDNFADPLVQELVLPATFLAGESCQLAHSCLNCRQGINFTMGYGAFIAAKTWSLKKLANQRELLDQIGQLLHLKLEAPTEQGIEIARYYTAVLDIAMVGYYRCPHCEAQYLIGYARHGTDNEGRGLPEPDTMHVQCIAQVVVEEQALVSAFRKPAVIRA